MGAEGRPLLLALPALLAGCSTVCKGPGCAAIYDGTRLLALSWVERTARQVDPREEASRSWRGTEAQGTGWVVEPAGANSLWIGLPDADQVVRIDLDDRNRLQPARTIQGTGGFGASLARIDLDGSGVRDLVVGAPGDAFGAGAIWIFRDPDPGATGTLLAEEADLVLRGTSPADRFGDQLTPCGDLSGDDRPELVVAAPWLEAPPGSEEPIPDLSGGVFLLLSEALGDALEQGPRALDPWAAGPVWWGDGVGDALGAAVHCRADLTGNRRPDLVLGAPFAGTTGAVHLIEADKDQTGALALPASGPIGARRTLTLEGRTEESWFGAALTALDVDGEAPLDLVVGLPGQEGGVGRVEIFRGLDLPLAEPSPWRTIRSQSGRAEPDHFGSRLLAGDLDGDGAEDLLIGTPDWYGGGNGYDTGRVFIWSGAASVDWPPTFTVGSATWTVQGSEPFERVGEGLYLLDADGDGRRDLVLPTRDIPPEAG